jgi:hypothetical protein
MKTIIIGIGRLDDLMARQSNAINFTLARKSGNWESINSIKVDYQELSAPKSQMTFPLPAVVP